MSAPPSDPTSSPALRATAPAESGGTGPTSKMTFPPPARVPSQSLSPKTTTAPARSTGAGTDSGSDDGILQLPSDRTSSPRAARRFEAELVFLLPALLVVLGVFLYLAIERLQLVPLTYDLELKFALVAVLGYLAVRFVGGVVGTAARRWAGPRRGLLLVSVYRLVAYTVLALALLVVVGVNSIALLTGGTFAGLVLGLAAQTVISNVMAGIFLLFVRPFEPGDRITMTTWQYGLIAPMYPPKFYSQDTLIPGYTGTVSDIGIAYTSMELDDGTTFRLPNSVLIGAGIISHELSRRWVRLKYEVPSTIDPEQLLPRLARTVRGNRWVCDPTSVRVMVNQATMTSYIIAVDALCRGNQEEPPRSELLMMTMRLVRELASTSPVRAPAT